LSVFALIKVLVTAINNEAGTPLEQKVQERTWDLEQARQEADAASRVKSDFLAVMSHET